MCCNFILYIGPCVDDIDSLNILCQEVSQAVGSERALLRTIQGPSDWHRRMERREECWERSRESIFECIVKNEALLEANVCRNSRYVHVHVYIRIMCVYSKNITM